jgi:hypothetical protein
MSEATERTKMSWDDKSDEFLATGILVGTFPDDSTIELDLTKLFPMWEDFTEVQKRWLGYGRQKPMDMTAPPKGVSYTHAERYGIMEAGYARLLAGDWNAKVGVRDNQLMKQVRSASDEQLVTLVGLNLEPLSEYARQEQEERAAKAAA